jgi:transposase
MQTVTTRNLVSVVSVPALYLAIETGARKWKVGFSSGMGQRARVRNMPAGALDELRAEISRAKERFGLTAEAPVYSCYEAGRDGFWIHRALTAAGVKNVVVDSSSIQVDRRARRAKSDGLDVVQLLDQLMRYHRGESRVWRVVRPPTAEDEDRRQLHRELRSRKDDRTRVTNRIKGLLATHGVLLREGELPRHLDKVMQWDGTPLPPNVRARLEREMAHLALLDADIAALDKQRKALLDAKEERGAQIAGKLMCLHSIGKESAWTYTMELFSWRRFNNGREVGALVGLVPTPYQSGDMRRELGITKAGNRHVRAMAIEIAWLWLRYQPTSALTRWYVERFASGGPVQRRKGIVALARKLLIALWRYVEFDIVPEGATLKT